MTACHYCGRRSLSGLGLRPYGPGGAPVCRDCANATPERRAATEAAMEAVLRAAEAMSPTGVVAIDVGGFHPYLGEGP